MKILEKEDATLCLSVAFTGNMLNLPSTFSLNAGSPPNYGHGWVKALIFL